LVTVPVIVPKAGSGVRGIAPAETDVPATTVTVFVVEINPDRLTVRVCGPGGTSVSVKFPLLSVVVEKPVPATVASARGAPVPALVTVPVVTLLPLVCPTSDSPDPQPDRALRSAIRTMAKRMPWL